MKRTIIIASIVFACGFAFAAEVPEPGAHDNRVRYTTYKEDEVTVINVRRGSVTRIILADDEKISVAATGFTADCSKDELEWCVRADIGTNQIWVKPKDNATFNNLEVKTDKRNYSFDFKVLSNKGNNRKSAAAPMFRVIFRYPVQLPPMSDLMFASAASNRKKEADREKEVFDERLANAKPVPRNWKYSMQILDDSEEIAPSMVFDDGRFTYFKFPSNREIPTFYYISPKEEEARINYHMEGDLVVVQRMGRRFVLRLGEAVVGVWNDAYDPDGVAPKDGTTIKGIVRTSLQEGAISGK